MRVSHAVTAAFDDPNLVSCAGLVPVLQLAQRAGLHRLVAERVSANHEVDVLTTCARDYVTWKNELPPGVEQVNGITVRRFPVAHERKPLEPDEACCSENERLVNACRPDAP